RNVATYVVDWYQRHTESEGEALGKVHTHEQRADKARRVCNGHGVYVRAGEPGYGQGAVCELVYHLYVAAGGYLRHHPAVYGVEVGLGEHLVGQHLAPVAHKGHGCLVAGGFNG